MTGDPSHASGAGLNHGCDGKQRDTSPVLRTWEEAYQKRGRPIRINFRSEVSWIPYNSPRFTHSLHSYPAKVIPHIPHFFLAAASLSQAGAAVLDPFGGSGTVAVEACLARRNAIVSDANPLARLLTRVKTTPISPARLTHNLHLVKKAIAASRTSTPPDVVNLNYWYPSGTIKTLARIAAAVKRIEPPDLRALAQAAFSSCVRKASLCDPRISVPVRLNPDRYSPGHRLRQEALLQLRKVRTQDIVALYLSILQDFSDQVATLWPIRAKLGIVEGIYHDSLGRGKYSLENRPTESVDMIITSPPYLGAQKYVRATSLSLNWLGLAEAGELRRLEDMSIGREHFLLEHCAELPATGDPKADRLIQSVQKENPLRAKIATTYLQEMHTVLQACHRLLRPGGKMVLVSGCNTLCGRPFDTSRFLRNFSLRLGFKMRLVLSDTIKSRGLMTRRNQTAGLIPTESVALFEK